MNCATALQSVGSGWVPQRSCFGSQARKGDGQCEIVGKPDWSGGEIPRPFTDAAGEAK
jgi:hypothetical protein